MVDNNINSTSPQQPQSANGRPLLKKVKRPIKKLVKRPLSPANPHISDDLRKAQNSFPIRPENNSSNQQTRPIVPNIPTTETSSSLNLNNDINFNDMDDIKSIIADMSVSEKQEMNEEKQANLPETINSLKNIDNEPPQFVSENDLIDTEKKSFLPAQFFSNRLVQIVGVVAFLFGFLLAKLFFTESTIVNQGLQGVVANPEVPRGRARCGIAERTQGCVLYIMNPQRQDLNARDFYDLAAQLTGRQRFVIETGNMRYSNVKISPGEIAQFNIPPLQ